MKVDFKKYLFEVTVIFLGITISFVFESWRENRVEHSETIRQLTLLRNDLDRNVNWIKAIDSTYQDMVESIDQLKNGYTSDYTLAELTYELMHASVDFPLRDLSPYISQISNLN